MTDDKIDPVPIQIAPHPAAPLFLQYPAGQLISEAINIMVRGSISTYSDLETVKQTALVSLWFFTKFIAGFNGPFDQMNNHLHVDMSNFRQKLLYPGARGAMFIPRSHFKSSLCTESASAWEIYRWANIRIRITNAIADYAGDFMHSVKSVYDDNEIMGIIAPQLYVTNPNTQTRWNDTEMVIPGRSRSFREATVEYGGVGGSSEGHHYDLHVVDDLIGQKAINSMRIAAADMQRARNWFWNSEKSLLVSVKDSRVIVIGTRYATDDVYDDILRRARSFSGRVYRGFEPRPDGRWDIYYRMAVEDGKVIFPENWTAESYQEMKDNPDTHWTWVTQFLNDPSAAELTEFSNFQVKKCIQDYHDGGWWVTYYQGGVEVVKPVTVMDLVQGCDPAASEKYVSAKTSKTAQGIVACDDEDNKFILSIHADYTNITNSFEWLFSDMNKYNPRVTALEQQGPFKILGDILNQEQLRRGKNLRLLPVSAPGDKDARIRAALEPELHAGRVFVDERFYDLLMEEVEHFPQSQKKDILDMLSIAFKAINRPLSPEEEEVKLRAGK